MAARQTRAAARAAAAIGSQPGSDPHQRLSDNPAMPAPVTKKAPAKRGAKAAKSTLTVRPAPSEADKEKLAAQPNISKKRKRTGAKESAQGPEELPHGLGTSLAQFSKASKGEETAQEGPDDKKLKIEDATLASKKESKPSRIEETMHDGSEDKMLEVEDPTTVIKGSQSALDTTAPLPDASQVSPTKKSKRPAAPYGHRFGETPFPDFHRPTQEECHIVNDLLTSVHGEKKAPAAIPAPSETFAGCGEVPSVLDALIRTLLSANTSGANSGLAIKALIDTFGTLDEGTGKGSVDWDKVRRTPVQEVAQAIRGGGNQIKKSGYIKGILDMVYEENSVRREALANPETEKQLDIDNDSKVQQSAKLTCADPNVLSLDHMHALSYHEAFYAFLKYPGIALKTSSCVCLYCLQRPSFAVDTHVQRITGWLGWRPEKSDENKTFSHLEYMIPDELKYSLHTLFVLHGKECVRCNAKSHEDTKGWEDGCVIDHLVKRLKNAERKKLLKSASAKKPEESGDEDGSLHEDTEDAQQPKPRPIRTGAKGKSQRATNDPSVGDKLSSTAPKSSAASKTSSTPAKGAGKGKASKRGKPGKKGQANVEEGVEGGQLEDGGDLTQADEE